MDRSLTEMMQAVNAQMGEAVKQMNEQVTQEDEMPPIPPVLELSEKLATAMLHDAEVLRNLANSIYEQASAHTESVRAEIRAWHEETLDVHKRLEEFGKAQIAAHEKFHNGNG